MEESLISNIATETTENQVENPVENTTEVTENNDVDNDFVSDESLSPTEKTTEDELSDIPPEFLNEDGTIDNKKMLEKLKQLENPAPEGDYKDDFIEELGLSWGEGEQALEWRNSVNKSLKDAKISQEQFEKIMPLYHQAITNLTGQFGPPVDIKKEEIKLKESWEGETYKGNMQRISEYAKKLPPEIFKYPLNKTAAGMELLAQLAKNTQGPTFIRESESFSADDLRAQLSDLINDPAYHTNSAKGKLLQQKADAIANKLATKKR